jgi:putative ABC transport system permease protein
MTGAWKQVLRSLRRNRRRNIATGTAIALGYAALVLLGGYILRVENYLRTVANYIQYSGHQSIYGKNGLELHRMRPVQYRLSAREQEAIAEVLAAEPDVDLSVAYLMGNGLEGNGCKSVPFTALGVEPGMDKRLRSHPAVLSAAPELARPLRGTELTTHVELERPVALSTGLAKLLGKSRVYDEVSKSPAVQSFIEDCEAPEAVQQIATDANVQLVAATDSGYFSAVDGDVVSIIFTGISETEDSTVVTSLKGLQELYGTERVTYVAVFLKRYGYIAAHVRALEARLQPRGLDVSVYSYDDKAVNPHYVGTVGFLLVMASFISIVVFSVVLLSVLNSMTLNIIERTREIGTLRSLGFTRGQMLGLFLREGLILAALSVASGLVLALGVAWLVNRQNIRFSPLGVPGTLQFLLTLNAGLCVGLAVVLGVLGVFANMVATRSWTRESIVKLMTALSG